AGPSQIREIRVALYPKIAVSVCEKCLLWRRGRRGQRQESTSPAIKERRWSARLREAAGRDRPPGSEIPAARPRRPGHPARVEWSLERPGGGLRRTALPD